MVEEEDFVAFYEFLHTIGININEEIEIESCYHRTLVDNVVVYCPRILGYERTDDEYLKSGYASEEAWKISVGKRDVTLLRELEEMSKRSNFTLQIVEHIENYWGKSGLDQNLIEVSND